MMMHRRQKTSSTMSPTVNNAVHMWRAIVTVRIGVSNAVVDYRIELHGLWTSMCKRAFCHHCGDCGPAAGHTSTIHCANSMPWCSSLPSASRTLRTNGCVSFYGVAREMHGCAQMCVLWSHPGTVDGGSVGPLASLATCADSKIPRLTPSSQTSAHSFSPMAGRDESRRTAAASPRPAGPSLSSAVQLLPSARHTAIRLATSRGMARFRYRPSQPFPHHDARKVSTGHTVGVGAREPDCLTSRNCGSDGGCWSSLLRPETLSYSSHAEAAEDESCAPK
jgi:hypothetical protein